jgi:hypothetical protein
MEDGRRLALADQLSFEQSIPVFAWEYLGNAFGFWGSGATSMSLTIPAYQMGAHQGAEWMFAWNSILTFFISLAFVTAFMWRTTSWKLALASGLIAAFLWPYTFELVFFPSLEEKGVLLAAALLFWWTKAQPWRLSLFLFVLISISLLGIAATTKGQIVLFLPAIATSALIYMRPISGLKRSLMFVVLAAVTGGLVLIGALNGGYSGNQRAGSILQNAQGRASFLVLFLVFTYLIVVILVWKSTLLTHLSWLVPLVLMLSFYAGIVYFGVRNYHLSIFGVMFGSAVAVVVGNLKSMKLQQLATVGLIVVTIGWTLYRIPQVFEPLHGIGAFTQGQIAKDLADEGAVIYTSCVEGSGHFNYYTERKWGVTPEFKPLEGDGAGYRFGIPDDGQYVFGDRRLCAAPGEMAEWELIWASPGDDGFRLYKRPA